MKKLIVLLLALTMVLGNVFVLVSCGGTGDNDDSKKSAVQIAIEKAQNMTDEELEAAARAELEAAGEGAKFNCDSLTSGIKKALVGFEEKYTWAAGKTQYNSKKGSEYQPKLTAAQESNSYIADFVMIQDAAFVKSLADAGFLRSYVPSGSAFKIDDADKNPLVGVTFNKVFMYYDSTKAEGYEFSNVWQLTGADGVSLKGVHNVSYQNPLGEDVNMSFLIMLTSPAACEKLTAAYKSYFGKDYEATDAYKNIGYQFVAEFIKNVGYWHSSDSTAIKNINTEDYNQKLIFAGLCKLKDYPGYKVTPETDGYYKTAVKAAGWNNDVEGFPGFVYNMWTLIPDTAKMPYMSCLFVKYLLSEEGYNKGWGGILGYYSSNQNIHSVEGDPALSEWKKMAIVEDVDYINSAYASVVKFINQQMSGVGK